MASAHQVLAIARDEIGTTESPPDSNVVKYSRWYPMNGSPWCAMFVSWVLDQAGITAYKHAYTPTGADRFRQQDRWFTSHPEPGDLVYYDFPPHERIEHVGLVVRENDDGSITTIEGNTSSGDQGSQSNGGGVFRRRRLPNLVVGYGRPPYEGSSKPEQPEKTFKKKASFGLGDEGSDVRIWQRQLNAVADAGLDVTGEFDQGTLQATRTFQEKHGLEVDGEVGPLTLATMEKEYQEAKRADGERRPILELHDTGPWVKRAQKLLARSGFDLGPDADDGRFGKMTATAVSGFRRDHGLRPVPVVGRQVWELLLKNE
jgi:peptidoglycan hydrolase-like protein with peptidoglycan-binding domain